LLKTRILHLEDDLHFAAMVKAMLEEIRPPFEILHVEGRKDFEKALGEGGFDLILSEYALPDYDGLSALSL
jgi:DNA-binding response OmpR family regulator